MKKLLAAVLSICILISAATPALAAGADSKTVEQTIKALGIMTGDQNGNMNLGNHVTRAEFTKMLVAASVYRDTVEDGSNSSPFKDVKYTHWASGYIRTAVDSGWVTGYIDGSFRPGNTITLEEAASCILKLLGYGAEDLSGTFPNAQISKFKALKLDSGLNVSQGQQLTRSHCMYIFYNLMGAETKTGAVYGTTLGYAVNSNGEIDYSNIVSSNVEGPYVLNGRTLASVVPFSISGATVYRNGKLAEASAIMQYDVIYYNSNMQTVWAYSDRVIGTYTSASPSLISPDSVTVAGNSYVVSTSAARQKLSSTGEFNIGDTVALLLGMEGDAVDVVSAAEIDGAYYGVVTASSDSAAADGSNTRVEYKITVACTDGVTREFPTASNTYKAGDIVSVSYSGGELSVKRPGSKNLSGAVNSAGTRLGSYALAEGVQILDVSDSGDWAVIYSSRLAGASLNASNVHYYVLNADKEISHLILKDATGDMYSYGVLTGASESGGEMSASGSYSYIINGVSGSVNTSSSAFGVKSGPAVFSYRNGQIDGIKNLESVKPSGLSHTTLESGDDKYQISEQLQVYLRSGNTYALTELSSINMTDYTVTGYFDTGFSAGGLIRVIVAVPK